MWLSSSLLMWAIIPKVNFLQVLVIGACITPTDPVLSAALVRGRFADRYVPKDLRLIILAESGVNDGLGYPFIFLPLYLLQYTDALGRAYSGGVGKAIGLWFGETLGYVILLGIVYGVVVGWVSRKFMHWVVEK